MEASDVKIETPWFYVGTFVHILHKPNTTQKYIIGILQSKCYSSTKESFLYKEYVHLQK